MEITIVAGSDELQQVIATWRYPEASDFYDGDAEPVLNPERFFTPGASAVPDDGGGASVVAVKRLGPDEVADVDRRLPLNRLRQPAEDGSTYLIAWDHDQPVGHAHIAWDGTHMGLPEIQDVFVVPERRRRGVATELTRAAEDEARGRGWESISLSVSLDGNPSARRLYEGLGFLDAGLPPVRVSGEITLRGRPLQVDDTLIYLVKSL